MIIFKPLLFLTTHLLLDSVECASQFHIRSHIRNIQNQPRLLSAQVADLLQNEVSSALLHDAFVISNIQLHRRPAYHYQHVEFDVFIDEEAGAETTSLLASMKNVIAMSIQESDIDPTGQTPSPRVLSQDCKNGGFRDNGTCICPEYFNGELCDYLYCFNYGVYDNDKPYQCNCPPGFNDYQCLNRNCRPPIIDDINPPARTLIVVLPSVIAFQNKRKTILNNLPPKIIKTVSALQTKEPGWIGYYVGVNFMTDQYDEIYYQTVQSANLTDFIAQMKDFAPLDNLQYPASDMDVIQAIDMAFFAAFAGNPMGNALILAFTDTANNYDRYTDYTGVNEVLERVLIWRAKVFLFVIDDVSVGNRTIDTSSTGFDNLRYFTKNIHAPLYHFSESEISMVMSSVVSKLYRTQYVDVRLLTKEASIDMLTFMDYRYWLTNNTINVIITLDLLKGQTGNIFLNIGGGSAVQPTSSGKYWQMYELSPETKSINITKTGSDFSYSVFQWLSAEDSFLWGIHETPNIDIGGVYTIPEKDNHIGVAPIGSQNIPFMLSYTVRDATSGQVIPSFTTYYLRKSCTLAWEIIGLSQCNSGPYVHYLHSYTENGDVIRVFPAFCRHALDSGLLPTDAAILKKKSIAQNSGSILAASKISELDDVQCNATGLTAFADQRFQPVRQYIFAVEWADNNFMFLEGFLTHVNLWINSIYNKNMQQMFTLIVFDINANNAKTLVSDHYKDHFLQRVNQISMQELKKITQENFNTTESNSDSLSAVIMGNLQTILPRAVVHVITQSATQNQPSELDLILPKGIEVNYFYVSDDISAYPFNIATRQTNGRWFNTNYADNIVSNFGEETESIELIFDEMYMLPVGTVVTVMLDVESSANTLEIFVTGIFSTVTLSHPKTNITLLENDNKDNTYRAVYDVSIVTDSSLLMQISCTFCTVQARVATSLKMYFGFTSDMLEDINVQYSPSAWVRANTSQFGNTFLVGHVSGLKENETIENFSVTINQGPMSEPIFIANHAPLTCINMIPRLACGYQYYGTVYSDFLREIVYDGLRFKAVIKTSTGSIYTRIVYYYIPQQLATSDTCNGAPVNKFGECVCGANYTGKYCQNLVCQNDGYSNFGACNCGDNLAGLFCETVIDNNVLDVTSTTTTMGAPTTRTTAARTTQNDASSSTIKSLKTTQVNTPSTSGVTITRSTSPLMSSTLLSATVSPTNKVKTNSPPTLSSAITTVSYSSTTPPPQPPSTTKAKGTLIFTNTIISTLGVLLFI